MEKNTTLDYIKAIADVRSISAAAENLGISQPALSSYLKKQEKEVGAILFDRSKQPLELTEAGKAYLDYLDKALSLQKELMQNIDDIQDLKKGRLTIGGANFFNVVYIPKAVAAFSEKYPGVEIEIVDGRVPEVAKAAQNGVIDLFITPVVEEEDRFCYEELLDEKIYLAVPGNWEINGTLRSKAVTGAGGGKALTKNEFEKLCENTFIVLKKDQHIGRKMEELFGKFRCRPQRVITAEQTMTTLALTLAGVGVSLITESSVSDSGLKEMPALYLADSDICRRKLYVAYPRNKYLSKAAIEFINTLKAVNKK